MTADLVLAALNMALEQRKPHGVIHNSDQGSQGGSASILQPRIAAPNLLATLC